MTYKEIRKTYPLFEYSKYTIELEKTELVLTFDYSISNTFFFKHKIVFAETKGIEDMQTKITTPEFTNLVFHLGLIEMLSYWKLTCSPRINITAGALNVDQLAWWQDVLISGMGQYFFTNTIDFSEKDFVQLVSSKASVERSIASVTGQKTLIPVGGGKDSIVTLETLKNTRFADGALLVHPTTALSTKAFNLSRVDTLINVARGLDPELFNLNSQGFLNGHVPFTAILFFISLTAAFLGDYKNVVFSNEKSSDEANVEYLGLGINHQYSKTQEFEDKFRIYNQKYLSTINLYSLLRPLYDIQIAKIFSGYEKYFKVVRSCNVGQRAGVWCCNCPKCLSTFILLFPFIGPIKMAKIFPHNLYEDEHLIGLLDDLVNHNKTKPFECVGTRDELKVGLYLALRHYKKNNLPAVLAYAKESYLKDTAMLKSLSASVLTNWDDKNNIPSNVLTVLKKVYENTERN